VSYKAPFQISTLTRSSTWWDFKLPPVLFLVYLLIPAADIFPIDAAPLIFLTVLVIASAASFGHVINDTFDIQSDALAGKPNAVAGMTPRHRLGYLILFTISGFLPLILARAHIASIGFLALIYISVTLYSAPPIRTKERGWLGLLSDATAAHVLPSLLVFSLVGATAMLSSTSYRIAVMAAVVWQMSFGLRAILVHQVRDRDCDKQSGTQTLVLRTDPAELSFVAGLLLLIEILMLLVLLWMFYPMLPTVLWFTMTYLLVALCWQVSVRKGAYELLPSTTSARVPMFELYEFFLPLMGAFAVALHDRNFWFLPLLHFLLFHRRFIRGFNLIIDRLHAIRKPDSRPRPQGACKRIPD
jgi:1,4-dihydroxy-2-naphthoate octaprenyltransferase